MSNLHCPNCDHLIGTLKPAELPAEGSQRNANTWALAVGWEGWQTSGEVHQRYSQWARERGLDVPTQRMLTSALVSGGAKWKPSNRGRLYARS